MFPPNKILFPIDFSDRCAHIAPAIAAFAKHFHSQITLLHVSPPGTPEDLTDDAEVQLQEFAARPDLKDLRVRTLMLKGDPAREIVEYAQEQHSDLIAMPTHGYGPFRRFLLGSVTSKVLHDARCPVWTDVHAGGFPQPPGKFRSVVCALDLSQQSRPTLRWAADFAQAHDARLLIVHAVPSLPVTGGEFVYADWQEEQAEDARKQIECLQKTENTHAPVDVIVGEVARTVHFAATEAAADLLVIGRSYDDSMMGRLRTHAYGIIRHSPCPVVSV